MVMKTAHVFSIALLLSFGAAHSMDTAKALALGAHGGFQTGAGHVTGAVRATVKAPVGFVFGDKVGADTATTVVAVVAAVATYKGLGFLVSQIARVPVVGGVVTAEIPVVRGSIHGAFSYEFFPAQAAETAQRLDVLEKSAQGAATVIAELQEFRTGQEQANADVAKALESLRAVAAQSSE